MFRNPYADGLIILVIVLLFFGPKRLPSLARSLGESAKEFKNSIGSHDDEEDRPEITQATAAPVTQAPATPVPVATVPAAPAPAVPGPAAPAPAAPAPAVAPPAAPAPEQTVATASPTPASAPADSAS
jgi:TatA/E family protein of Tat protein translocase